MMLVKNGRVIDPARNTDTSLDILLDGERIAEVAPNGKISGSNGFEIFDASGLIVAPGLSISTLIYASRDRSRPRLLKRGHAQRPAEGLPRVCCMPTRNR